MNVLVVTDKLIMGGAENYFCKLENELFHPDFCFYFAAATGELYSNIREKKKFTELHKKNHMRNLWILWKIIKERKIKLYHANSLRMVLYGAVLNRFTKDKFRIIYTKHNVTMLEKYVPSLFRKLLNGYTSKIITVSDFEKYQLMDHGIESKKISTVYNGVDLEQFKYYRKKNQFPKKVGILARISKEKNHSFFLEVVKACNHIPELTFHIAGDGPDYHELQNQIEVLGLKNKVTMLGGVKDPEIFLEEMDVLLVTSHREVFPMVILEAMAVGTPIISIDRGGIKEAVENETSGYLISQHSTKEFSRRIEYLLDNELKRLQVIRAARRRVESNFSLENMVMKTLAEYSSVMGMQSCNKEYGLYTQEASTSLVRKVPNHDG